MSDIPGLMIKGVESLGKLLAKRKIKGRRVKLITKSKIYQSPGQVEPTIVSEVLEGQVEDVFAYPSGLVLESAVRYLRMETTSVVDIAVEGDNKGSIREFIPTIRMSSPEHLPRVVQLFSALERIEFSRVSE